MTFETMESALVSANYTALGQAVTYTGQVDGVVSINVILDREDDDFPSPFAVQVADADAAARVRIVDVPSPRRGDTITDAASVVYTIDEYRRLNNAEWRMELKE